VESKERKYIKSVENQLAPECNKQGWESSVF
jgi:hypothetical protein